MELPSLLQAVLALVCFCFCCCCCCWSFNKTKLHTASYSSRTELQGKHVLITDTCQPAVVAIAKLSLLQGAYVTLVCRNEACLVAAQRELHRLLPRLSKSSANRHENGGHRNGDHQNSIISDRLVFEMADIRCPDQAKEVVASASGRRPLDLLICSYATGNRALFDEMDIEEIEEATPGNLLALMYVVHGALPSMRQRPREGRRPAIVLVSSCGGLSVLKGARVDAVAEYGLKGLAELLRFELLQDGLSVHLVLPGAAAAPAVRYRGPDWMNHTREGDALAEDVAAAVLEGVRRRHFLVTTGVDGFLAGVLTRGFIPATDSCSRAFLEILLLLPLRLLLHGFHFLTPFLFSPPR